APSRLTPTAQPSNTSAGLRAGQGRGSTDRDVRGATGAGFRTPIPLCGAPRISSERRGNELSRRPVAPAGERQPSGRGAHDERRARVGVADDVGEVPLG